MDVGTIVWISITKFFGREKNVKNPNLSILKVFSIETGYDIC